MGDRGRGLNCWAWSMQEGAWLCVKGGVAYSQSSGDAHRALQWGMVGWGLGWLARQGRGLHERRAWLTRVGVAFVGRGVALC